MTIAAYLRNLDIEYVKSAEFARFLRFASDEKLLPDILIAAGVEAPMKRRELSAFEVAQSCYQTRPTPEEWAKKWKAYRQSESKWLEFVAPPL